MRRYPSRKNFLLACAIVLTMAGCDMRREDPALRHQVDTLAMKLDSLTAALELQRENDSVTIDESSVVLTPGDSNAFVKTGVGYLTARVEGFEAFGGGTRVTLRFGNPGSVTLRGMRARLEWNIGDAGTDSGWRMPALYEFMADLKPGALTTIRVTLDDLPPERLRAVRISRVRFEEVSFSEK